MKRVYTIPTVDIEIFACESGFQASSDFSVAKLNDTEEEY